MKGQIHHPLRRLQDILNKVPLAGWCFILLIFGYAFNETWPFFSSLEIDYRTGDGTIYWAKESPSHHGYGLTMQTVWKGFTDLVLQSTKAAVMCLLIMRYIKSVAWFFYIMFWYSVINMAMWWYNFCQWPWFFYLMWAGLVAAAIHLWPKKGMRAVK